MVRRLQHVLRDTRANIIDTAVQLQKGDTSVVPTITVQDIDSEPDKTAPATPSKSVQDIGDGTQVIPGDLPAHLASAIPSWYKVGWRQMSGIDNPPLQEGEEKDKGILDVFLSEQFYGSWYHNAALIVFVGSCASFNRLPVLISCFSGCFCFALPNPLWLWLGLAVHHPCYL